MNPDLQESGGMLAEIGWGDADPDTAGRVNRAIDSALLLSIGSTYWGLVWLSSGLAPLVYLAGQILDPHSCARQLGGTRRRRKQQ